MEDINGNDNYFCYLARKGSFQTPSQSPSYEQSNEKIHQCSNKSFLVDSAKENIRSETSPVIRKSLRNVKNFLDIPKEVQFEKRNSSEKSLCNSATQSRFQDLKAVYEADPTTRTNKKTQSELNITYKLPERDLLSKSPSSSHKKIVKTHSYPADERLIKARGPQPIPNSNLSKDQDIFLKSNNEFLKENNEELNEITRRTMSLGIRERRRQIFEKPTRLSLYNAYSATDIRWQNENNPVINGKLSKKDAADVDSIREKKIDDKTEVSKKKSKHEPPIKKPEEKLSEEKHNLKQDDFVSNECIKEVVQNELFTKLDHKTFDSNHVNLWCGAISSSICDKVRQLTKNKAKVLVNTFIGESNVNNNVHVAMKCEKVLNQDDFITVALEGDSLYAWVSLMLAKY